jgi:mono/diheme cytochrome c family protein
VRQLLKWIGYILAALVAAVAMVLGVVYWKSNARLHRVYHVTVTPPTIPTDAASIERGHHIAMTRGCAECHGTDFGGAKVIDDPAMGRLYGPNLTRGRGGLPATFGDADWARAIRHGVAADGHGLFLMPSADFSRFTTEDMGDLIAYLKSVPPVDRDTVPLKIGPVARILMLAGKIKLAADEIDHAHLQPDVVKPEISVAYGRYLAVGCTGCHGPNFSGGKIAIGPPDWPPAANLTPHADGSFAKWTQDQFLATMRTAKRPDGRELNAAMPRAFGQLTDTELKALWTFLKTLPAAATGVR